VCTPASACAHTSVTAHAGAQGVEVVDHTLHRRVAEAPLRPFGASPRARAHVRRTQERDAQPGVEGRANHRVGERRAVVVGLASPLVVHVVKLAHGHDAGAAQLFEGLARDGLDGLGRERVGEPVHRLAPRPEGSRVARRALRGPAQGALKREAVGVDEARQDQRIGA
jgi:hypothetical protein